MGVSRGSVERVALAARWLAAAVALCLMPSGIVRADDGVDHALDVARPRSTLGVGYTLGAGTSLETPTMLTSFDPSDPRVGVILLAAYGPSPLLLIDRFAASSENRDYTIGELLAASVGLVIGAGGFVDAFSREDGTSVAFGSLATAQAMAINLQMLTNGIERLVFGNIAGTAREAATPTFLPVPFQSGAGIVLRWEN